MHNSTVSVTVTLTNTRDTRATSDGDGATCYCYRARMRPRGCGPARTALTSRDDVSNARAEKKTLPVPAHDPTTNSVTTSGNSSRGTPPPSP